MLCVKAFSNVSNTPNESYYRDRRNSKVNHTTWKPQPTTDHSWTKLSMSLEVEDIGNNQRTGRKCEYGEEESIEHVVRSVLPYLGFYPKILGIFKCDGIYLGIFFWQKYLGKNLVLDKCSR